MSIVLFVLIHKTKLQRTVQIASINGLILKFTIIKSLESHHFYVMKLSDSKQ